MIFRLRGTRPPVPPAFDAHGQEHRPIFIQDDLLELSRDFDLP